MAYERSDRVLHRVRAVARGLLLLRLLREAVYAARWGEVPGR